MMRFERLRGTMRQHPFAVDCALAALVTLAAFAPQPDVQPGQVVPLGATVVAAAAGLPLAVRRKWPRASFAAVVLATTTAIALAQGVAVWTIAEAVGLFTLAVASDRRTVLRAFAVSTLVLVVAVALTLINQDPRMILEAASGQLTSAVVAAGAGLAVRSRRASVAAAEDRANRAERTREEEARRQLVEERLRIARELHDVVAHHVAVVSVQAGVAEHLILKQPQAAREALVQVQRASATILDELAGILNVLRQPGDQDVPAQPAPGLSELDALVGSYADAGLLVQLSRGGQPRPLGVPADLVAYRVVQEALTNAHKHGGPTARVVVTFSPNDVVIEIANPLRASASLPLGSGLGITGMRERASAVGGELQVRPDVADEFRVRLTLPSLVTVA
jgi:signal transduction histidine kinase